jgi:hypothetical protein
MLADAVDSGEKFLQPCGALSEGKEGKGRGGPGLFVGVAGASKRQGVKRIEGRNHGDRFQ